MIELELVTELKNLINKNKRKTLIYMLIEVLKYKLQSNIIEFYSIIGELINANFKYFLNSCYSHLKNKASKVLTPDKLIEMDKYILENFCFKEKEKLLTSFKGEIKRHGVNVVGYIYLTNLRFLADGKLKEKKVKKYFVGGPKRIYELPFALAGKAIREARIRRRAAIKEALLEDYVFFFKKNFPIKKVNSIERTKDKLGLRYSIKLELQDKDQIKEKKIKYTIHVFRHKKEKHKDQINRVDGVLTIIEETLKPSQIQ